MLKEHKGVQVNTKEVTQKEELQMLKDHKGVQVNTKEMTQKEKLQ